MRKNKKNSFANIILKNISAGLFKRNRKFKNIHEGESCYIFGNGSSLKNYDLNQFKDKVSIGCNMLLLHKDFDKLDVRYYYEGHPFFYYPFWKNPYSGKYVKNVYGRFHKKKILSKSNVDFFVNLSNYFGLKGNNIYYTYHFNKSFTDFENCELDGAFPAGGSALSAMLGIAIYMGFKDITLVGCDYTLAPQKHGHFYEKENNYETNLDAPLFEKFLHAAVQVVSLRTMVPNNNYRGHILLSVSYESLAGVKPVYRSNEELLSYADLSVLNKTDMSYKIF